MSGSRGEANFVWRCKSCKVRWFTLTSLINGLSSKRHIQRESTATIKAPPTPYQHASPPKRQKIVEFDCRGLEFTEFKADVSTCFI